MTGDRETEVGGQREREKKQGDSNTETEMQNGGIEGGQKYRGTELNE
jgi:hypothetical protein